MVRLAGIVSGSVALDAAAGPLFVTTRWYVNGCPTVPSPGGSTLFESDRSALGTVVVAWAWLLPWFASSSFEWTSTLFTSVLDGGDGSTVASMSTPTVEPTGTAPRLQVTTPLLRGTFSR